MPKKDKSKKAGKHAKKSHYTEAKRVLAKIKRIARSNGYLHALEYAKSKGATSVATSLPPSYKFKRPGVQAK